MTLLAPVLYPEGGPRCGYCNTPGEWRPCCRDHEVSCCDPCRSAPGFFAHRDPKEMR